MKIAVKAPAKVNLSLDVLGKRPDGYHELRSVFQTVSLYDTVTIEPSEGEDSMELISGDGRTLSETETGVPTDGRNLMMKAVKRLREALSAENTGLTVPPVHMTLLKRIPSQAGLGGGSSDAAAVLLGLNRLFSMNLSEEFLISVAKTLGADVPFLLVGGTAECRGIGEKITPLPPAEGILMLLVKPPVGASTKEIFEKIDENNPAEHPDTDALLCALRSGNLKDPAAFSAVYNVLQPVTETICPEIAEICAEMRKNGAFRAFMSGSGTTCVGIFGSGKALNFAREALSAKWPGNCYFSVKSTAFGLEEIPV